MKTIVKAEGYFTDSPNHVYQVNISLGSWNGLEDAADSDIFFYMDNEPLEVGQTISENFVITSLEG